MKRRDFLKKSTAAALASSAGPYLVGAEDKAGGKNVIVGAGRASLRVHSQLGRAAGNDQVADHARRRRR